MPLMRGETSTHRDVVMLSEATWQAARGVRTPEWKYIRYLQSTIYGRDGVELYDLARRPRRAANVADQHPEVVETMAPGSATGSPPSWPADPTRCSR